MILHSPFRSLFMHIFSTAQVISPLFMHIFKAAQVIHISRLLCQLPPIKHHGQMGEKELR